VIAVALEDRDLGGAAVHRELARIQCGYERAKGRSRFGHRVIVS
jgi:hypothetical protein